MNSSTDTMISISLDRQAEMVRRVQAASQSPAGEQPGRALAGRTRLALATSLVVIASLLLVFVIR